jgi:hypothetical protein
VPLAPYPANQPGFDEVTSPPVFTFDTRSVATGQIPRGFNELRSLQEEDVAHLGCQLRSSAARSDRELSHGYEYFSQRTW